MKSTIDEDIREDLADISKNVQAVGRMIGSKRLKIDDFDILSDCLKTYSDLLNRYKTIIENREE